MAPGASAESTIEKPRSLEVSRLINLKTDGLEIVSKTEQKCGKAVHLMQHFGQRFGARRKLKGSKKSI